MPKEFGFYYLDDGEPPKTFERGCMGRCGGLGEGTGSCSGFWNVNGGRVEKGRGQDDSFVQGRGSCK